MDLHVGRMKRRMSAHELIYRVAVVSCVTCFIFNTTFLVISLVLDEWVFGYVFCQLYALLSQVLVAGSAWVIALAAVERIYNSFIPEDHDATFSYINVKILVNGIYFIFIILYTAPIYGWGEYSSFRGGLHLAVSLTQDRVNNVTTTDGTYVESIVLEFQNRSACSEDPDPTGGGLPFNPMNAANVLRHVVKELYTCEARPLTRRGLDAVVRFMSADHLSRFYTDFVGGDVGRKLEKRFKEIFTNGCGSPVTTVAVNVYLKQKDVDEYTDIHLPFQDIAVCSLDFSPVNPSISTWIPLMIATSTAMPYALVFASAVALFLTQRQRVTFKNKTRCLLISSIVIPALTVPYYYANVSNNRSLHVSYELNVGATLLYHASSSFYVLSRAVTSFWKRRKQRTEANRKASRERISEDEQSV